MCAIERIASKCMYIIKFFISFLVLNLSFSCPPYHSKHRDVVTIRFDTIPFQKQRDFSERMRKTLNDIYKLTNWREMAVWELGKA